MNDSLLEIGHGIGEGPDSFQAGATAATQASAGVPLAPRVAVMVYASVCFDLQQVLRGIQSVLPDIPLLGCTTAGEICNGPLEARVVVTVIASPCMKVSLGLGREVARGWSGALDDAILL